MDWFWNALWARIGWAMGEFVLVVSMLVALVVGIVIIGLLSRWRQSRCPHGRTIWTGPGQSEHRCRDCRKLLTA